MKMSLLHTDTILERANRKAKFQAQLRRLTITQAKLADKIGVDKSTISRYKKGGDTKKGGRQPSLDTLRALAKQGVDVVNVFDIKTDSEMKPRVKSGQRSKAGSSRVSDRMLQASQDAQLDNQLVEPQAN